MVTPKTGRFLVIKYTDGSSLRIPSLDKGASEMFVMMEGDHVEEWWIEKEREE